MNKPLHVERFEGKVELLAAVNVSPIISWINRIGYDEWPQQHPFPDGRLRPAMVSDPAWNGFGGQVGGFVSWIMQLYFPGCSARQLMLSAVMAGDHIPPHRDQQPPDWVCRVHAPLIRNPESVFLCDGEAFDMWPGWSYRVNTLAEHAVVNKGRTPRVHFMFDVHRHAVHPRH